MTNINLETSKKKNCSVTFATCQHFPQNSQSVPYHITTQVYTNCPFFLPFRILLRLFPFSLWFTPAKWRAFSALANPENHRVSISVLSDPSLFLFSYYRVKVYFLMLPFGYVILCDGFWWSEIDHSLYITKFEMGSLGWNSNSLVVRVCFWGPQIGWSVGVLKKLWNLFREKLQSDVFDWGVWVSWDLQWLMF